MDSRGRLAKIFIILASLGIVGHAKRLNDRAPLAAEGCADLMKDQRRSRNHLKIECPDY